MSCDVIQHPKAEERMRFEERLEELREEFVAFCLEFRPRAPVDESTADLAAAFAAFKLDNGEGWCA